MSLVAKRGYYGPQNLHLHENLNSYVFTYFPTVILSPLNVRESDR